MSSPRQDCQSCGHSNRALANYCGMCGQTLLLAQAWPPSMPLGDDQRYRVEQRLGAGGFGEAYLVEDRQLQRLCVAKRLKLQPAWSPERTRTIVEHFEREAQLLVALNNPGHPNIPEIFAYLPASRCLVMKYVTGTDLLKLLKRRSEPLPELEALRYMRDAASALAYMHSRTPRPVLHGDLKPQNVMLDEIGRVWLIDFGLARRAVADTAVDQVVALGGTPGYTPPEQWYGQPEPRSDVYALAATLYELVTGQRPPRTPGPPEPPPHLHPQVAQLITRAMALDVAERPSASAFLAALDDLLVSLNVAPPPAPERPPAVGQVVGRARELAALVGQLTAQGLVGLSGMAGMGKTTLAVCVAQQVAPAERTFWHRFRVGERAEVLVTQLAGWLAHLGRGLVWQQLQRAQQSGGQLPNPELLVEQLIQLARGQHLLLCCDDRHWIEADDELARVLGRLEQAALAGDLRLIITSRGAALREALPLNQCLGGLEAEAAALLLSHERLQQNHELRAALATLTAGNPQFLVLANAAAERMRDPQTLRTRLLSHAAVEDYLLRELDDQLTEEERQVLEAVALLRDEGGSREVLEILLPARSLRRTLKNLVEHHLLITSERNDERIYMLHAIVQHFYYEGLASRMRRSMHQQVAAHYAQAEQTILAAARHYAWGDDAVGAATLLSNQPWRLLSQGHARAMVAIIEGLALDKLDNRLQGALRSAYGEAAALLGDHATALLQLQHALQLGNACGENGARQARRYRLLAQVYERSGDYQAGEAACRAGLALSEDAAGDIRTESARLYAQLGALLWRQGTLNEAAQACHAGLAALPDEPAAPGERSALLQRLAMVEGARSSYRYGMELLTQSLELARQAGDALLMGAILHNMGYLTNAQGQQAAARHYYQESLRLKAETGDLVGEVLTIGNLGMVHLACSDTSAARDAFMQAEALGRRYQLPSHVALALSNLGQLAYEQGAWAEAESHLHAAMPLYAQLRDPSGQAACAYMLGDIALAKGDGATALHYGVQGLAFAQQAERPALQASALRVIGEAQMALGQLRQAGDALAQAQQLASQVGDPYDQALVLAALAHYAQANNNASQAQRHAAQSLSLAERHAIPHVATRMRALLASI